MKKFPLMTHIHQVYLPKVHDTFDMLNIALFIHVRQEENKTTNTTQLVQSLMFGTGPTVNTKVALLLARGDVERVPNPKDKRQKILRLTELGLSWLQDTESSLKAALK
jgi:DNA-binding MarR family transcriptional regulator